jgi:hypothetical protein
MRPSLIPLKASCGHTICICKHTSPPCTYGVPCKYACAGDISSLPELQQVWLLTFASMTMSFPPRKNAVLLGSRPLGMSSNSRVLFVQSKCWTSVLAPLIDSTGRNTYSSNTMCDPNFTCNEVKEEKFLRLYHSVKIQVSESSVSLRSQVVDKSRTKQDHPPRCRTLLDPRKCSALPS